MSKKEKLKSVVTDSYLRVAKSFDNTRQTPWKELEELTSSVQEGDNILDLGCGNGRLLKALTSVNFNYLGIDSNQYLLQQAEHNFPEHIFVKSELPDLPDLAEEYDFVFMIASFHHLVDKEDRLFLLQRIKELLKPDGTLIMTNWNLWQSKYFKYILTNWSDKLVWNDFFIPWKNSSGEVEAWRYYHGFTSNELRSLLKKAGFKILEHKKEGHNYITKAQVERKA